MAYKNLKLFIVEEDDDNRERVLECRVDNVTLKSEPEFHDMHTDYSSAPVARYMASLGYSLEEMRLIPFEDGSFVRIRNFMEEDSDEGTEED